MTPSLPAVVTGASGFIGRRLLARLGEGALGLPLAAPGWESRLATAPLAGRVVYHLAARVHRAGEADEAAFHRDNVDKAVALARAACGQGARSIVFASTIKVFGEESSSPFLPDARHAPEGAYARSKSAAEAALIETCRGKLPLVIVRLPLVYGAHAAGNLARLRRLCDSPLPLPFAAVHNRRSWVHVEDLVPLLLACGSDASADPVLMNAVHPDSASTPRLLSALRQALGRPPRLFAVPAAWLEAAAGLVGGGAAMRRLTRSLEADGSATWARYGWTPRRGLEEAAADIAGAWA